VVAELLVGPEGQLAPLFTYPAELLGVWVDDRGHAYVDLSAPPTPLEGSHTELLVVYGVVDSILLNCPELRGVQLLFGGTEVDSLTGHLDLSRPLALNKDFIVAS
jgi:germination protein M